MQLLGARDSDGADHHCRERALVGTVLLFSDHQMRCFPVFCFTLQCSNPVGRVCSSFSSWASWPYFVKSSHCTQWFSSVLGAILLEKLWNQLSLSPVCIPLIPIVLLSHFPCSFLFSCIVIPTVPRFENNPTLNWAYMNPFVLTYCLFIICLLS